MRFNPDHKHLGWLVNSQSLMKMVKITDLRATIIEDGRRVLKKIEDTPHYAFLNSSVEDYYAYEQSAGILAGFGNEHSVADFHLLCKRWNGGESYGFDCNALIEVRDDPLDDYYVILDGVHRAALFATDGFTEIPVMVKQYQPMDKLTQFDQYLSDFEGSFKEWYTPIKFDDDRIIHERTYPSWTPRVEFLTNKERGQAKWDYIIQRNMPQMKGRRILDIGCNVGLFALNMSMQGAEVVGVDRGAGVVQPTNTNLGSESVIQQAWFVHNLFVIYKHVRYNVSYYERDLAVEGLADIMDANEIDTVTSFCVLYHFGRERMIELLEEVSGAQTIVLQANHGHGGPLGLMASADTHVGILRHFGYKTDIRWGKDGDTTYKYPLIIGTK